MNLRSTANFIIGICMVGALGFLYAKVQSINVDEHQQIIDTLRRTSAVNYRWDQDVLQTKLSISTHYDAVTNPLSDLDSLKNKLASKIESYLIQSDQLKESVDKYLELMKEKDHLVENFKGQNAILHNSLHYISTAVEELNSEIDAELSSSLKPDSSLINLRNESQDLLTALLEYNQLSQQDIIPSLERKIAYLNGQKDKYSDSVSTNLQIVLNHASVILKRKPEVDKLMADIVSLPIPKQIDKIEKDYTDVYDKRLHEKDYYFSILVAYASLLLLLIAYIGYRLRNSYRELNVLNKQLKIANETLEERVVERTQELSKAYAELKQSQAQLIQSEKMASLGQMVAGVAHEINTPLAYCHSNIEVAREQLPEIIMLLKEFGQIPNLLSAPEAEQEFLKEQLATTQNLITSLEQEGILEEMEVLLDGSLSGLDQISDMVKSLKDFSRLDQRKVENSDLNKNLDSVLVIANNTLKGKVEVIKHYGNIPLISCSPSQLNQVFLNLIVNAAQAIENHGAITIETFVEDDLVHIVVEDNGKGIPSDVLPRIFDPFFTTKEIGKGTGLGLSIAYKIVEQHGGNIKVKSEVNKGTQFIVSIPVGCPTSSQALEIAA